MKTTAAVLVALSLLALAPPALAQAEPESNYICIPFNQPIIFGYMFCLSERAHEEPSTCSRGEFENQNTSHGFVGAQFNRTFTEDPNDNTYLQFREVCSAGNEWALYPVYFEDPNFLGCGCEVIAYVGCGYSGTVEFGTYCAVTVDPEHTLPPVGVFISNNGQEIFPYPLLPLPFGNIYPTIPPLP